MSLLLAAAGARAQSLVYDVLYRPPEAQYFVLDTPHFALIFEGGYEAEARETAAILEAQVPAVRDLVGLRRTLRMPVVLNGFNDVANGYVTPLPFKQEIEAVSLKGSRLSARFPSWLWGVAPHELVHAAQAEAGHGFGLGMLLRPFAPDAVRSFNLTMPRGIVEGAAVYHESRIVPGAGRLHFSQFQMPFRAAMLSDDPWSLAQLLETPAYTRPFDRMYIGGAHLFAYLAEADSARFFRRAIDFHYRFPFAGHGAELWYGTGQRPRRLYRAFREGTRAREQARLDRLGSLTEPERIAGRPGRSYRRPRWLDDSTLVAYASGYAMRPGFYRIEAHTGRQEAIAHHRITEDFYFSLDADSSQVLFSRYVTDPVAPVQGLAEAFRLDLTTGVAERLTDGGRVFAPVEGAVAIWALQNEGPFTRWVSVGRDGRTTPLADWPRTLLLNLLPSPEGEPLAVLAHAGGRQGLFRVDSSGKRPVLEPWLLLADASIYDADWSPDGQWLVFTADPGRITNVFALHAGTGEVRKLTNVPFGALEPAVSPDARWLAFVEYRHEAYTLVRIPFAPHAAPRVPDSLVVQTPAPPAPPLSFDEGAVTPYRAARHLAPRMVFPTLRYDATQTDGLGVGAGLALQGADPLERWSYGGEGFWQDGRLWGEAAVQTGRLVLRPFLTAFDLPSTALLLQTDEAAAVVDTVRVRREARGLGAGWRLPLVFRSDVFSTAAAFALRADWRADRFTDAGGEVVRPFVQRVTLTPSAALGYRLQQNTRDLLPNTGFAFDALAVVDVWNEAGTPRRALEGNASLFVPVLMQRHTGLRLHASLLTQNRSTIFDLDRFLPRGYEDDFLGPGTFARLGIEAVQPLRFLDDGFVLVPVYLKVLYGYGFAETVRPIEGDVRHDHLTSAGAGLGLALRLFHVLDLDLRLGVAWLFEEKRWDETLR